MSATSTPRTSPRLVDNADQSTLEDLQIKLKLLEDRFLGSQISDKCISNQSPYAAVSTIRRRIEAFRESLERRESRETVQSKLPSVALPQFDGSDLEMFLKDFERWLRLSGVENCSDSFKLDWLIQACTPKVKRIVEKIAEDKKNLILVLETLELLFPKLENDITLRQQLEKLPMLVASPEPSQVAQLFIDFEEICSKMSTDALGRQEKFILLTKKVHPKMFSEMRLDRYYKRRTETFEDLKEALIEKSKEDWLERHLYQQKKQSLQTFSDSFLSGACCLGDFCGWPSQILFCRQRSSQRQWKRQRPKPRQRQGQRQRKG